MKNKILEKFKSYNNDPQRTEIRDSQKDIMIPEMPSETIKILYMKMGRSGAANDVIEIIGRNVMVIADNLKATGVFGNYLDKEEAVDVKFRQLVTFMSAIHNGLDEKDRDEFFEAIKMAIDEKAYQDVKFKHNKK